MKLFNSIKEIFFINPNELEGINQSSKGTFTCLTTALVTTTALIALTFLAISYVTIPLLVAFSMTNKIAFAATLYATVTLVAFLFSKRSRSNNAIENKKGGELSDEEKKALRCYTDFYGSEESPSHREINRLLRLADESLRLNKKSIANVGLKEIETCNHLIRAIHHLPPSNKQKLWRGAGYLPKTTYEALLNSHKTQKPCVVDGGFLSFSADKEIARGFLIRNKQIKPDRSLHPKAIFFVVKEGTAPEIAKFSNLPDEREHLYQHHKKFVVVEVKEKLLKNYGYSVHEYTGFTSK